MRQVMLFYFLVQKQRKHLLRVHKDFVQFHDVWMIQSGPELSTQTGDTKTAQRNDCAVWFASLALCWHCANVLVKLR